MCDVPILLEYFRTSNIVAGTEGTVGSRGSDHSEPTKPLFLSFSIKSIKKERKRRFLKERKNLYNSSFAKISYDV